MSTFLRHAAAAASALLLMGAAAFGQQYDQTVLVANTGSAPVIDPDLVNPWGMSRGSGTPWWVSDQGTGLSTLYSGNGTKVPLTVTIPAAKSGETGTPTGTIYNGSATDFLLAAATPARFLFSTLDGQIIGWNSPTGGAVSMVKMTDGSSYTGLTSASVDGHLRLYAANFTRGRVDVFDTTFKRIWDPDSFNCADLPEHYLPFNVQAIGDDIVVTYALHEPGNQFETDGPGNGYVLVYSARGRLLNRLEHGNWLNAPWGVALAPLDFGKFSHDLLIAQWSGGGTTQSSGYIAAYDLATGHFKGLLQDMNGNPLAINGVWAISPGNGASASNYDSAGAPAAELWFTAGPGHGAGGQLGYLTPVAADLIQGNDQ
jgi:uncharacterized protein (TIGR03118 family)